MENNIDSKERQNTIAKWTIMISLPVISLLILLFALFSPGNKPTAKKINKTQEVKQKANFSIVDITSKSTGNYINNQETFVVKTENGSLEELQKHLYLDPPLNYTIEENKENEYSVIVNDIPSNTLLNLNYVNNEVVDYKWAFQSTKDMVVTSIYPDNKATNVSNYTSIEINLSYADVTNLNPYFHITPEIEGTLSHIGKTWIFKPSKQLEYNKTYEITIDKGFTNGTYTAKESYKSSFSTYNIEYTSDKDRDYYSSITVDKINTFLPSEKPIFKYNKYLETKPASIKIYKFKNLDNFMKFLNKENNYSIEDLGNYGFQPIYRDCYVLEKELEVGYYLEQVTLDDNKTTFNIPVQINELSAYALSTKNDILVWVASGNKLLEDINVKYLSKSSKTDKDGIAIIKYYNNDSDKIDYVYVGDNNPLVVGINNSSYIDYPSSYIYTDRPLYKNTDKVQIWGFIPIDFFTEKIDYNDFALTFDDKNLPITINKDGSFIGKINLNNVKDDYYDLKLSYKNQTIGWRYINVKNYEKQNYDYEINYDKNVLVKGEKFVFDINVKHITGISVPNKEIIVLYNNKEYVAYTNVAGNAHFEIEPTDKSYSSSYYNTHFITIKNSGAEYNDYNFGFSFIVIDKYATDSYNDRISNDNNKITGTIININPNKVKKISKSYIEDDLEDGKFNGTISLDIIENTSTRVQTGTTYNSFTKTYEPNYSYNSQEKTIATDTIDIKDGKLSYTPSIEFKNNTEDVSYWYEIEFNIPDGKGNTIKRSVSISNYENNDTEYRRGYRVGYAQEADEYNLYRYYLDVMNKKYSIDDSMDFVLKDYTNIDIKEQTKFLEIKYKNSITDTKIYDGTEDVKNVFTDKDFPGMKLTSALLLNGHFYRLPELYYDFNEEDRKLNIDIKPNKSDYKPQEEVEVTINTKDKNNNGIKTRVLVSVVDEKVFKTEEDLTNILEQIYTDIYYDSYTYSTFRDYELFDSGGGAGATSGPGRADFGDTIYFKEVETDENGMVKVNFKLNDSITSYRITVHSINKDDYVGVNKTNITSSIPLAIEFTKPRGLKDSDDTVINATSIGNTTKDIEYTFSINGISNSINKTARVGNTVYANFGKLKVGTYKATISAKSGNNTDKVSYDFEVLETQQEISKKETYNIKDTQSIKPKKNPVTLDFYRESFKDNINFLNILKETNEDRLDILIGYYKSLELEDKYYLRVSSIGNVDITRFKNDKELKYLPAEASSKILTALVTYYSPSTFKADAAYFNSDLSKKTEVEEVIDDYLILAALKEPVLDDIKYIYDAYPTISEEKRLELALALCFLGDYTKAKDIYDKIKDDYDALKTHANWESVLPIISTFVDKENAKEIIDSSYQINISDKYVYFAMMSYLENNSIDISSAEELTISYGNKKEKVVLNGLTISKITLMDDDLKNIKFSSKYNDILVDYYYEGELKESDNVKQDIKISLSNNNPKLFSTCNLVVDLSRIDSSGILKVYLPNALKLSGTNTNQNGIYLSSNQIDYLTYYISKKHDSKLVIPLYLSNPGNYHIEEMIIKIGDTYHISNSLDININE